MSRPSNDPTKPEIYKLVFDVLDEYIEVMKPAMIHFGHDEMFFPVELCPSCQLRDPALLVTHLKMRSSRRHPRLGSGRPDGAGL